MLSPRVPLSLPSAPRQNPAPLGAALARGWTVARRFPVILQRMPKRYWVIFQPKLVRVPGLGTPKVEGWAGHKGCRGQGVQWPYQAPGFVVVQVDKSSDVIFAFLVLGIHELLGFLVAKLHIIPTAPPLPGGALCAWPRCGRGGGPAPCQLTATLQQLAHAAGLRDGVAHSSRRDGVHKGCFADICRRTDRAGVWGPLQQARHHPLADIPGAQTPRSPSSYVLGAVPWLMHPPWNGLSGAGVAPCKQI